MMQQLLRIANSREIGKVKERKEEKIESVRKGGNGLAVKFGNYA